MMDKKTVMERIERSGIVPVAVIDAVEKAVPLADAMLDGGVDVIEVTFRTAAAADAIRAVISMRIDRASGRQPVPRGDAGGGGYRRLPGAV